MSLKQKFLKQIFPPLMFSVFLTAVISTSFIIYFHFSIIMESKNAIFETEKSDLHSFARTISKHFEEILLSMQNDIEMLVLLGEHILSHPISNPEPMYTLSAYAIASGAINLSDYSGYENGLNYDYSMWYVPGNNSYIPEHMSFFLDLDLVMRSEYEEVPAFDLIFGFFEEDGFQFQYPSSKNAGYLNYTSDDYCPYYASGKMEFYDMRCRTYGQDIHRLLKSPLLNSAIMISAPYFYFSTKVFGITLCGYSMKNSTQSNFTLIPPESRTLNFALCVDIELREIVQLQNIYAIKGMYFFIMFGDSVFYHPKFEEEQRHCNSITEFEFGVDDLELAEESLAFNRTILEKVKSFYTGANFTSETLEYTKQGKEYVASFDAIQISRTGEAGNFTGLTLVVVEPKDLIFLRIDDVANSNKNYITVQVIIFGLIILTVSLICLYLINLTVKSIITPINDLLDVLDSMLNDDMEADVTKNYTPNSEEINQLYQSFSKLKFILKYANEEFFSGNDAKALINYSNALNLYTELNQKDGIGMAYNNIGNIHLKNERYSEAVDCYRKAVKTIESELEEIYKDNMLRQTIFIQVSTTSESESAKKIFLPISRRRKDKLPTETVEKVSNEKLAQLNEMYSNRIYQLATTLYKQAIKEKSESRDWSEIISFFKKVIEIDSSTQFSNSRIIQCLIFIAACFMELNDSIASLKYLQEAETSISLYERVENALKLPSDLIQVAEDSPNSEIHQSLRRISSYKPKFQRKADILKQDLMYHYGIFYKKVGKYKLACIMLTKCIETGKIYDPLIRKNCLELLSTILARQNLLKKAPNVTSILARMGEVCRKDIVFLLDYSESMAKGARIQYAIRNFAKIFDKYIQDNDKIGFIRFNLNCELVFALTPKKQNTFQLRLQIQNSLSPFGKTAFYDALMVALRQFQPKQASLESNEKRTQWIVSLTDGEDNSSLTTLKEVKKKLKSCDVNLIIVGMGLSAKLAQELKELCKSTKDGTFIESPNNDDLDVAFQAISQRIYGENLIVESFSS